MTTSQDTASWKALLSGQNGIKSIVLAGGTALHATNIYLSTTILPSVIEEIGGLSFYAWNTTLFMVASIIGSVLSRKILSKNGAKASFRIAFLIFGLGTLICGLAPSMLVMLLGRTIQGFGGGIIFALAYAMIRLIFEERFYQSLFFGFRYVGNSHPSRSLTRGHLCRNECLALCLFLPSPTPFHLHLYW